MKKIDKNEFTIYRKRDYFGTYGTSCIYKNESLHGSRLHFEYRTGTHRICRCHALHSADNPALRAGHGQSGHQCDLLAGLRIPYG